ncbi:MAG: murein biosynthesis integral membrane protein MurJ [Candidatus Eisenbacteria bacterium]
MSARRPAVESGPESGHRLVGVRVIVSAFWVIGFMLLGKILGLGKDVVVAARFGTSSSMDTFLVAFSVPTLLISWFRSPIRSGFIPLFTESMEKHGEKASWRAAGVFTGDLLALVTVIAVAAFIFAPRLVSLVAPGFATENLALATTLVRTMIVTVVLSTVSGITSDILHIYGNFVLPGVRHPVMNLILIGSAVFLTGTFGVRGLAYGVVAGSVAGLLIESTFLWQHRSHVRLGFDLKHPMFLGVMRLALPLFIGMAGAKLDDIIDRVFASMLAEGSISGLSYAMRLIDLPREILVVGFSTVLFPFFARVVARGRMEDFSDRLMSTLRIVFFVLFPISVVIALLGEPFVRLVFQRGAFDEQSVAFTTSALLLYTPTLWALGLTSAMISGFVAMKDTKTPVIAGFLRLGLKIGLIFALIGTFQLAGIALATSISHVFKLVLFFLMLPASVRKGRYGRLFKGFGGVVASAAVMGALLYFSRPFMMRVTVDDSLAIRILALGIPALGAIAVYLLASYMLARGEFRETTAVLKDGLSTMVGKVTRRRPTDGGEEE